MPAPAAAPEIILDRASLAVGNEHLATSDASFADKVTALVNGKPSIEGRSVDVVVMRNAVPSQVTAMIGALRASRATAVVVKTSARDDSTQSLPLAFAPALPDCTVVAWIAKDGAIDVWPVGGGRARRVGRGLAGPDMTLGMDAVRTQWAGCNSSSIAVGGEDTMTWGLVFDLATSALQAPGSRASNAVLLSTALPGKKVTPP